MRSRIIACCLILCGMAYAASAQTKLVVGDKAPDFSGKDQDGNQISLQQFKGKKVILYFYPKDDTPGCTAQACNLRDNMELLTKEGYEVLGVSSDDETSHKSFKAKYSLPFTLIADTDKSIHQKYGVWVEKERDGKKFFGTARTTFLIDEKGVITQVIDKVETKDHTNQIIKF
jgi:thioredoxin-dependent peroxiredoxin